MGKGNGLSETTKAMLAQIAPKAAAKPVRAKPKPSAPTPEQMGKATYERRNSLTYRRQPLFETLAKTHDWISDDALRAMRMYREWYEASNKSLTRCSLDVEGRGGGMPSGLPPIIGASFSLLLCQAAIGTIVDVFDKIVLDDKSFSDVAIERFGSRRQNWLKQPTAKEAKQGKRAKFVEKIVPRSGRHRELVAHEFQAGLKRLVNMIAKLNSNTRRLVAVPVAAPVDVATHGQDAGVALPSEAPDSFAIDARFFDEAGYMRPYAEIAAILLGHDPEGLAA